MTIERYMDLPENNYGAFDEMTDEAYELFVKKSTMFRLICTRNVST
jgi:hypothetical protein